MSSLFKASQPKVVPEFTGLQINTAVQTLPIPILWGTPRVAINLIYYNGFKSKIISTGSSGGGGKGILSGGKGGSSQQVEYFATIILGIGEGVVGNIVAIYQDQGVYTTSDYPSPGLNLHYGTPDQSPWSYVVSNWPSDARGYMDTAYLAVSNAQLDSSATVPQINLLMQGIFAGTCVLNHSIISITSGQYDQNGKAISFIGDITLGDADADPARVIYDFLTSSQYGAGFPLSLIDSNSGASLFWNLTNAQNPLVGDSSIQTYCQAVGFGWSVVLNNVESANSVLERWCKNLVVAPVWTGELLKFIPYWDQNNSNNPGYDPNNLVNGVNVPKVYYVPNITPYVSLTVDHLLQAKSQDEDPITFSRNDPMLVYNTVRVDYRDRTNFFNDNVVEAKDEAHAEFFGPRVDNIGLANEFTLAAYANASAQAQLRRNVAIRRKFSFRLGPLWAFLDPMDIVQIPDPTNWAAIISVRIISCEDDEDEITTYTAEEFPLGASSPAFIPTAPTTPPNQGATNSPASPVFPPVIFEPTSAMLTAQGLTTGQVIVGASGGTIADFFDTNWGGCYVWVSLDNVTYKQEGIIKGPSTIGYLTSSLPAYIGTNPDNTDTLSVDLGECDIALVNFTSASAALGNSLCIVLSSGTFELLSYTTATLTGTNRFNLTGLYRALYGTTSRMFANGSQFMYLGTSNFFEEALPAQYIGKTLWVKLQSFNVFNSGVQDISTCVPYQYIPVGETPPAVNAALYGGWRRRRVGRTKNPRAPAIMRRTRLLL